MHSKLEPFRVNTFKINQSIRTKSLVDATGEQILQISQTEINFVNTESNQLYEITLNIRNVSHLSQKIKIRKPTSPAFTLQTSRQGSLAAGLDMKLTVVFDSKDNQFIKDKITILTENTEIEIPVNVYPHVGKLQYEPFINFGFIKIGNTGQTNWQITNKSETPIKIKLKPLLADQSAKLTLSCQELSLQEGEKHLIKLALTSKEPGLIEGTIEIEPKVIGYSTIEFVANFCQFNRILSNGQGKQLQQIMLEPLFGGQTFQTNSFLVNNTPESCQYRISRKKGAGGDQSISLATPEQIGRDDSEKLVQFTPSQGELEAYTSAQITATVMAKFEEADHQLFCNYILGKNIPAPFEREWTYTLRVYLNHDEHHLDLPIKGISLVPKIGLTPSYLSFPNTALQQKSKKSLRIENFSVKAAVIEFENSANYSFFPQKIKILPKQSTRVEVVFSPKIIGDLNEICCLNLGVFSFPIKLFGKSVFGSSKTDTLNMLGQQIPIEALQGNLEQQISAIQKKRHSLEASALDCSKNSIHFDTYRHNPSSFISEDKSGHIENHKKVRLLRNKNGKQLKFDVNHLNPNQPVDIYPPTVKNQQEERLVSKQLSSLQLRNISVGPVIIDFGTILLRSVQKKYFHICNFNPKPISIKLETAHESFAETSDQRQILPGESHGGFAIVFQALAEGPFKHTLQYVLNGSHFFQLLVTGTCLLPTLNLSRNQIKFIIGEEDRKFQKRQSLKLENNFQYDVSYQWKTQPNSLFSVQPNFGIVKANSFINPTFIYDFQNGTDIGVKIQDSIKLKIKHGKVLQVKCSAFMPESPCVCKTQQLQYKEVAVGRVCQSKILVKNMSKISTIFKIVIPKQLQNILIVPNKTGNINAEQMIELTFKLHSIKTMNLDSLIQILCRGSKTIELPVRANVILPQVRVENAEIDFGSIPVQGNPAQKDVILVNDSNIPVDLQLRLHNDTFLPKNLKLAPINDSNLTLLQSKQLKLYRVICLRINAKCKGTLTLQFIPQTADQYEFYLPLFIPNTQPLDDLQKRCTCKGIKNRLMAMQKSVSFGKTVIQQNEQIYSKSQTLQIFNPQEQPISWWVQQNGLAPFRVDKKSGRLQGFERCLIKIYFSADTPGEYQRELQFFIDQVEVDISRCYMKVQISASACFPTLYFDQPYVILPTVRCGQTSSASLQIYNGGYQNINLKHSVTQEFSNIDLRVKYLSGSNLGVTKKQIKLQVSFASDKPVSFTVKLIFYDNNGRSFPINVSGTADTHTYTMIEQDKNGNNWASNVDKSCQFMRQYINNIGQLSQQLYEFPKSLIQNEFQKLSLLLINFSPALEKVKTQVKKNCKTFYSFQYISEIIKILKAQGAFLNHIRPQMLLSYQQYLQNIKIRAEDNLTILGYFKKKDKNQFQLQQKNSWLVLFYQIFKIYSRINPGKLKNNSQYWVKFTTREKIILTWLEKTYLSEAGIQIQSKGNQILSNLNTCQIFSALISKYTNIKVLECYGKAIKSQKQKQKRCKTVIDTFSQIGINCLFRMEDLLRSNQKQMLLVLQNLYTILPSYLQKGEPIIFTCQFGQVVTKSVQITNPSKHQLTYIAKIEGCKAYSVQGESQFVIQSKKTHEVKIKYVSNINLNNSPATLTLTGMANNKFTPSTFVFVLKSNNLGRISEKSIHVTGNLYQQLDFSIKVTNNFEQDGDFKIQMQNNPKNIYNAFYLLANSIKIRKGQTASLSMIFIPFTQETQQICLIFRDEKVGEFQYQLNGLVQCSIICQEILRVPQTLFTHKKYSIQIPIPTRNDLLMRARKAAQFLADRLQKKNVSQRDPKQLIPINYDKYYPKLTNNQVYTIKLTTPNNSIFLKSDQIIIKDIELNDDPAKREEQKIGFEINLKSPIKEGSFTVNLRNASGTDIRKYKVTLSATARPLRYQLQMKTPSNKPLSQPLPLINISQQKNIFHVSLSPSNDQSRSVFSIDCDREIIVEGRQQGIVTLNFRPKMQNIYNSFLKMQNITTGQCVQYQIVGIGEEPQAETIMFQQEVRKEKNYSVKLPLNKLTRCIVQSFGIDQAIYTKNFQSTSDSPYFKFKIQPKVSGRMEGKLIIEAEQQLLAYKIVINVKNTIQNEIKLRTIQRKEVVGQISPPNDNYILTSQDHNLKFPDKIIITDNNPTFQISYYSSKPQQKEIFLTLTSEMQGELTYLIKVIVESMPEIKLDTFQIELGKTHREQVVFENTDDKEMTITAKSTHPNIFYVEEDVLVVQPRSKTTNWIIYKASSLENEEGKIYFVSDKNTKQTYHLSGYGLPQSKPEIKQMTVCIGQHICEPITFINPLNKSLPFTITLENVEGDNAFSMIMKSTKIDLNYGEQLEIPVTVQPLSVALNTAILKVGINQKICWKYQLRCRTIFHSNEEPKTFKIQTRIKNEQFVQFPLPFSQKYNGQTVRLNIIGTQGGQLLKGPIRINGGNQTAVLSQKVAFSLSILSYKPKTILTNFQICANNGCKWIYKVRFAFLAPPTDDHFQIAASINKPASVKFKLTNRVKTHAKFHAYFTSDSSIQFSVNPKCGELQPYGRQGTAIEVVFCPTQYKKSWSGRLIIETEDSYWSYEVRGVLPHYYPPVGKSSLKQG